MKFISWNVNGLRACVGKDFEQQFKDLDADFFCLQETKMQAGQLDLSFPGYESYWNYAFFNDTATTEIYTLEHTLSLHDALPHAIPEAAAQSSDTQSAQEPAQNSPSTSPITAEVPLGRRTRRPRWRPVTEEGTGISTADSPRPFRARTDRLAAQSHRAKLSHRAPAPQEQQKPGAEATQPRRTSLFARRPEPASSAGSQASVPTQGGARTQSGAPTQNASGAKPSATSAQQKSASQARTSRALPGWNFSEDVRVVDDSSVLSPREDMRRPSPSLPPRYSHVLDPKLDDSIDQGPMTPGSQTPSSVNRDVTIRPSITGQIPVFRRRPEDS